MVVVTKDFVRHTVHLTVKKIEGRHTAANILAEYEQLIDEWKIPRNSVCLFVICNFKEDKD